MSATFETLQLPQSMLKQLDTLNFTHMTAIQEKATPFILEGKDLLAQAKTGSGKTLSFGIGALLHINVKEFKPQVLIMTPTRELALQVAEDLRDLAKFQHNIKIATLTGGHSLRHQANSLRHGAHILVGTPGRIEDHLQKETLSLENISMLILDEADRMLEMGFVETIKKIASFTKKERQTLLYSATFPENIETLAREITNAPHFVKTESIVETSKLQELFFRTKARDKDTLLLDVLHSFVPESAIVFTNMKKSAIELTKLLQESGVSAEGLHGDLEQYDRDEILLEFHNRSIRILVATDVAARGLDIPNVDLVINYDLANKFDTYRHRIGRTARAGAEGVSITFMTPEEPFFEGIDVDFSDAHSLNVDSSASLLATMQTLCINGGKKSKVRAGDVLGTLVKKLEISPDDIGKITVGALRSYVAIKREINLEHLQNITIKKMRFKTWLLS